MLDERDIIIIDMLRKDARTPVSLIAKKLGISNTAVKKRIEKLENSGVISGYTVKVNDQLLGQKKALLILHVPFEHSTSIIKKIMNNKEKYESVYYRASSNAYMFYILTSEENSKTVQQEFQPLVRDFCPITLLEKLL